MRVTRRLFLVAPAALALGSPAGAADAAVLAEETKVGDCSQYKLVLTVRGTVKADQAGKETPLPLAGTASHTFVERVESLSAVGPGGVIRHYSEAAGETAVGVDRTKRQLRADRRLVAARRGADGLTPFSPAGPLTRDELDLVAEHFDTLALAGLLPNRSVKVGDTWPVSPEAAQAACLYHGLAKNDLVGKLEEIRPDGVCLFGITGRAEGVENGAAVKSGVSARGTFDPAAKTVTGLVWKQTDDRDRGPVSPAATVEAEVKLVRTKLAAEPAELNDAARAAVPADGAVPPALLALEHADTAGRFRAACPRDWHTVANTGQHLVLRLVDRGEFLAQATVSFYSAAKPGVTFGAAAQAFKAATGKQPGWEPEKLLEEGTLPTDAGRQIYRLTAAGKQDGQPVVQGFHLILAADGRQVAVTTLVRPEAATKVGARDVALVNAVDFAAK